MKQQQGVSVYDRWSDTSRGKQRPRKRWYVRVWDSANRRYHGRSFADRSQGLTWGDETRSRYLLKLDNAVPVSLSQLTEDYTRELLERGRNSEYVTEIQRVSKAVGLAGAEDLKRADVAAVVRRWLSGVKANWYEGAAENRFRRKRCLDLSPITKNRFLQHLRSLMRYAVTIGSLPRDPLIGVKRFTETLPLKPTFTLDELRTLLHPNQESDPYFIVFAVLIYTGCRMGEAMHLRWENIDFTGKRLAVKLSEAYALKRKKERTVFLQPELASILLPRKKPKGYVIEDERWRTRNRKHLGVSFKYYLKRCGVDAGKRSPHSTRHTWVSMLLATGENVFLVAGEAGHESLVTTQGYARTQGAYRDGVKGWERGVLRLRKCRPR